MNNIRSVSNPLRPADLSETRQTAPECHYRDKVCTVWHDATRNLPTAVCPLVKSIFSRCVSIGFYTFRKSAFHGSNIIASVLVEMGGLKKTAEITVRFRKWLVTRSPVLQSLDNTQPVRYCKKAVFTLAFIHTRSIGILFDFSGYCLRYFGHLPEILYQFGQLDIADKVIRKAHKKRHQEYYSQYMNQQKLKKICDEIATEYIDDFIPIADLYFEALSSRRKKIDYTGLVKRALTEQLDAEYSLGAEILETICMKINAELYWSNIRKVRSVMGGSASRSAFIQMVRLHLGQLPEGVEQALLKQGLPQAAIKAWWVPYVALRRGLTTMTFELSGITDKQSDEILHTIATSINKKMIEYIESRALCNPKKRSKKAGKNSLQEGKVSNVADSSVPLQGEPVAPSPRFTEENLENVFRFLMQSQPVNGAKKPKKNVACTGENAGQSLRGTKDTKKVREPETILNVRQSESIFQAMEDHYGKGHPKTHRIKSLLRHLTDTQWNDPQLLKTATTATLQFGTAKQETTPVFHLSCGNRMTDNTSTLFFARVDGQFVLLAAGAHSGRVNGEPGYRCEYRNPEWNVPAHISYAQKTVITPRLQPEDNNE